MKKILEKSGNFVRGKKWEPCIIVNRIVTRQSTDRLAANAQFSPSAFLFFFEMGPLIWNYLQWFNFNHSMWYIVD